MYKREGTISIGIHNKIVYNEGLSHSLDYLLKGIFYTGENRVKTIPQAIHFWAFHTIDEQFLANMKEVILSIKRMGDIKEKIGIGYVEFTEQTYEPKDLDQFLQNSKSKIYLIPYSEEGMEHDLRDIYEMYYRLHFFDVMFIALDKAGEKVKAWVHTPFLLRVVDI